MSYCGTAIASGVLTSATQVYTGRGTLNAVLVEGGATVTIYDNTSAAGKIMFIATAGAGNTNLYGFNTHVRCDNGLHVVVSGGDCIVYYGGG